MAGSEVEKKTYKHGIDFDVESMTASFGMTINLGDYESARIDRGMTIRNKKEDADMNDIKSMLKSAGEVCKKQVIKEVKKVYKMEVLD